MKQWKCKICDGFEDLNYALNHLLEYHLDIILSISIGLFDYCPEKDKEKVFETPDEFLADKEVRT